MAVRWPPQELKEQVARKLQSLDPQLPRPLRLRAIPGVQHLRRDQHFSPAN